MKELNFSNMCHIFVIPRGLRGHSLLIGYNKICIMQYVNHMTFLIFVKCKVGVQFVLYMCHSQC